MQPGGQAAQMPGRSWPGCPDPARREGGEGAPRERLRRGDAAVRAAQLFFIVMCFFICFFVDAFLAIGFDIEPALLTQSFICCDCQA